MTALILWFLGAYLSGSIPYGLILTRLFEGSDVRQLGSGNIGATNVLRTGRKGLAAATLLLDALKGALPLWLAFYQGGVDSQFLPLLGIGALMGHLFPIWLKGRGGKGVATGLGVYLALNWVLGVGLCVVWLLCLKIWRTSSVSALIAVALAPVGAFLIDKTLLPFALISSVLICARHHLNIKRLFKGEEGKI